MYSFGPHQALGTVWRVEVSDDTASPDIAEFTTQFLAAFEAKYSRFLPDSWVTLLNTERKIQNPDPEFVAILQAALSYYKRTQGVFNIAVGEALEQSGYDTKYSFSGTSTKSVVPPLTDALHISRDEIRLTQGRIDLGGIGKGWCIDQLATAYKDTCGYQEFLINGGGDMYATEQTGKPYTVTLTHPTQPNQYIGTVELCHAGFAASSPFVRSWVDKKTGQRNNHLLSEQAVASYVVAPSCTEADVWATTLALAPHTEPKPHEVLLIDGKKAIHQSPLFSLFT